MKHKEILGYAVLAVAAIVIVGMVLNAVKHTPLDDQVLVF